MGWTLVTGAAKGLGAKTCVELAKNGYDIVIHYNSSQNAALDIARECREFGVRAEIIHGDFSTKEGVHVFLREFNKDFSLIKHLVNNVGNFYLGNFSTTPLDIFYDLFQTNLFASVACIQSLLPSIKSHKGSIINIGVVGIQSVRADTYSTAYTLTKIALAELTKSLSEELAPHHVRVNMISPGFMENAVDLPLDLSTLPLKRPATLEEVVNVILFILDEKNRYITGQNIEVAGGIRL